MSYFSELLPKIKDISKSYIKNIEDDLKAALELFDKFEEEFQHGKGKTREKARRGKDTTVMLQSINEDDGNDNNCEPEAETVSISSSSSSNKSNGSRGRASKKRSKNEVDGISSPEVDKRLKRNASVKAQSIISKQVNVNLTQKLRRENPNEKAESESQTLSKLKSEGKENVEPNTLPVVHIKQEKVSLPSEPEVMETEHLPNNIEIKTECLDNIAMPPPAAPLPKPRRNIPKEKPQPVSDSDEETSSKRQPRTKRNTQTVVAPPTRSSTRLRQTDSEEAIPPEPRPKRTRAKKKISNAAKETETTQSSQENAPASPADPRPKRTRRGQKAIEKELQKEPEPTPPIEITQNDLMSPNLQKEILKKQETNTQSRNDLAEKEPKQYENDKSTKDILTTTKNLEKVSKTKNAEKVLTKNISNDDTSPVLQKEITKKQEINTEIATKKEIAVAITKITEKDLKQYQIEKNTKDLTTKNVEKLNKNADRALTKTKSAEEIIKTKNVLAKTESVEEVMAKTKEMATNDKVDHALDETHVISNGIEMDKTMVIPNGVYNHAGNSPKNNRNMNETMVIERNDQTVIIEKLNNIAMDATVVIDKGPKANLTEDDSLLTDDSDSDPHTPDKLMPTQQPTSAVKEKVQQFEEMASRVTRTKTRAMAKKEDEPETHTPPDKVIKNVLSSDTLTKMNNLIFNGKPPQISSSASKIQVPSHKHSTSVQSSASKLSFNRQREEEMKREDARRKKEAMLEAKREQQKRKREEKMAAAAAARLLAQHERRLAEEAAARERVEKQQQLDMGKIARLKMIEQKKLEQARKIASTEERRKAEELSRQQRLQEEQRRALQHRTKQIQEQEAMKREEARMAKEIEKKQREYIEKQKKQREDKLHTPLKQPCTPLRVHLDPVHMADGFQYLNSDEEAEPVERPVPAWSTYKVRRHTAHIQEYLPQAAIDRLFSVSVYSPDLREIFPGIERARLKRTSSAVWRTPPRLPALQE